MEVPIIRQVSECFIKPKYQVQESNHPYYLSPLDLIFLSIHYNQKGLLFEKPNKKGDFIFNNMDKLLESLKDSLSSTLVHFYPLAGQFEIAIDKDHGRSLVFINCNKGPGVRFVHAMLDMSISDIISPIYVPTNLVSSFFDHNCGEVNYDGLTRPLLSVQVTELIDGIFIGLSMNHVIVDGSSFWQFWNVWSEIHQAYNNGQHDINISNPPFLKRWFPLGYGPQDASFPFTNFKDFIRRFLPPQIQERIFHFTTNSIAKLKARANEEFNNNNNNNSTQISSFQALIALVWRSITRAKGLKPNQSTSIRLLADNRARLNPPIPEQYFGNLLSVLSQTITVGEILKHDLGWIASLLNQSVVNHNQNKVFEFTKKWFENPYVIRLDLVPKGADCVVQVGSSPRFNVYGNKFEGIGTPIAVRSGYANKFDGKVIIFPGCEGGGSVDLEISLRNEFMSALVCDEEFMDFVS